jgi:hypothetical protein
LLVISFFIDTFLIADFSVIKAGFTKSPNRFQVILFRLTNQRMCTAGANDGISILNLVITNKSCHSDKFVNHRKHKNRHLDRESETQNPAHFLAEFGLSLCSICRRMCEERAGAEGEAPTLSGGGKNLLSQNEYNHSGEFGDGWKRFVSNVFGRSQ